MTVTDYLRENLPTAVVEDGGPEVVTFEHPTDPDTCPYCGVVHPGPVVEFIDPAALANRYETELQAAGATDAAPGDVLPDVAQGIRDDSENNTGHARYFD